MSSPLLIQLDPRNIMRSFKQIDSEAPSYTLKREHCSMRLLQVLACTCVCLILIHYLKYSSSFIAALAMLSELQGEASNYWLSQIQASGFARLFSYTWWTSWHLIGYVLLPFLLIRYVLKMRMSDMAIGWGDTHKHWLGYALLLSPILFFIFLVSFRSDFLQHYPFYDDAGRSWFDLIAWEILYLCQFAALEFFFRGFILQSLRPAIGAGAIWVMCVPYLMIHFPKLWLEATGAIFFGFFLGILALRSFSIWGGFLVHAGVAVTMDLASLIQQNRLPQQFWPF
ncbi:CPBP family intramembrane glutamic endopeptidase [Agaribacterium sp. ZY112]|uniref:CPBP family intramembrane glutamic endopeptidase n=1 Tax=Agaribacterium sp. ZY112 TaxID=3233574 RepID=UPI003524C2F8